MSNECPQCGNIFGIGNRYCRVCGSYIGDISIEKNDTLASVLKVAAVLCSLILIVELICLVIHLPDTFGILDNISLGFIVIIPDPTVLFRISGGILSLYWLLVVAVIIISAVYALYKFILSLTEKDKTASEDTGMFWVSNSISFSILFNFICVFVVLILGYEIYTPIPSDDTLNMFDLANAAVWEEMITRVLYIGVPMALVALVMTKKASSLKCLLGGFGMSKAAVVFIVFSSVIFGIAHYEGWDQYWKVLATGVMGLFLGYIFVRFGLYAAILMHFVNNYLMSFTWLGVEGVGTIITLILIGFGIVVAIYLAKSFKDFKGKMSTMPKFYSKYFEP